MKSQSMSRNLFAILLLVLAPHLHAQVQNKFRNEIDTIYHKYAGRINSKDLIVFTGSSSIRRWINIQEYFPEKNIINTGFGGSQMKDLLYYADDAIIKYKPVQIFIYEGDNDISQGRKPEEIISTADSLLKRIRTSLPYAQIVLISVKPSVSRWNLKDEYISLNRLYKKLSEHNRNMRYIDVWSPLLDKEGKPKKEIFIADSLHINKLGYDIWAEKIRKVIR
jgi:lysophospholipase L1-like esterase